jgi:tRNA pseudouridine55 synthase
MSRPRKPKGRPVSGWLILDKPLDFGSTEAVSKIKWLFKAQKAGHAGTLDPLASGMLPIALGDATKTVPYVMDGRKIYEFAVAWGEERSTDDLEGEVVQSSDARPSEEDIRALLPKYTGVISQVPPQFSAIKIDGNRAYDLAREGETIDIPAREVEIFRLSLLGCTPNLAHFEIECGKGTYVRSLARDLGRALGCLGHIAALRRTRVGPFSEENAVTIAELNQAVSLGEPDGVLRPVDSALGELPSVAVSRDLAGRLMRGQSIILRGRDAPLSGKAYATCGGVLVAVGDVEKGELVPHRVFNLGGV